MTRVFFTLLLFANLALFAFIRWGNLLTQENAGMQLQPPLNAEKVKLLVVPASKEPEAVAQDVPVSATRSADAPTAVQAPNATPSHHVSTAPAPATDACLEWGEFSGSDLTSATADLDSLKLGDDLSQREVEHTLGYWVYIPPAKSQSTMNARIAQLKKLKIKDYFIVHESGKWHNAISLGVFKAEDVAERYLERLKHMGLKNTTIGERQSRLKFTVFKLKNPSAKTLSKMAGWQKDFTGIEMKSIPCN